MTIKQTQTKVLQIKDWLIIHLPSELSEDLPSRGMVMAEVYLNSFSFTAPLEPDGLGSHWFRINYQLTKELNLKGGDSVSLSVKSIDQWTEPEMPEDLMKALKLSKVLGQWNKITVKARGEWIRWIRFTANPKTRHKRIKTACSMLEAGKKRPCCFDTSRSTEPYVSKSGVLESN